METKQLIKEQLKFSLRWLLKISIPIVIILFLGMIAFVSFYGTVQERYNEKILRTEMNKVFKGETIVFGEYTNIKEYTQADTLISYYKDYINCYDNLGNHCLDYDSFITCIQIRENEQEKYDCYKARLATIEKHKDEYHTIGLTYTREYEIRIDDNLSYIGTLDVDVNKNDKLSPLTIGFIKYHYEKFLKLKNSNCK